MGYGKGRAVSNRLHFRFLPKSLSQELLIYAAKTRKGPAIPSSEGGNFASKEEPKPKRAFPPGNWERAEPPVMLDPKTGAGDPTIPVWGWLSRDPTILSSMGSSSSSTHCQGLKHPQKRHSHLEFHHREGLEHLYYGEGPGRPWSSFQSLKELQEGLWTWDGGMG